MALGSDGAPVMQGAKGGVIKLLKDDNGSHIVSVHCLAHRLELAFKAMHKSVPFLQTVEKLLLNLYLFYRIVLLEEQP